MRHEPVALNHRCPNYTSCCRSDHTIAKQLLHLYFRFPIYVCCWLLGLSGSLNSQARLQKGSQIFPGQLLLCAAFGCFVCFVSSGSGFDFTCSAFSFVWWWFQQLEGIIEFRISCIAKMVCSCFQSPPKLGFLFINDAYFNLLFKCCISISYVNITFHSTWKHSLWLAFQIFLVFMAFS